MNDQLERGRGAGGGLTRAYISELAQGVCSYAPLFSGAFGLPKPSPKARDQGTIPPCNEEEHLTYHSLGRLLAHCFNSANNKSGQCLNDGVYEAIYQLTDVQIQGPATALDRKTCVTMAQLILPRIDRRETNIIEKVMEILALILKEPLTEADFADASLSFIPNGSEPFLVHVEEEEEEGRKVLVPDLMNIRFDWERVQSDPEIFKNLLFESIFKDDGLIKELGTSLGAMISGIHTIAQGFHADRDPYLEPVASGKDLKEQIQGSVDREAIYEHMKLDSSGCAADIKYTWLRKWIKESATEEELTAFLRYVTGAPCLVKQSRAIRICITDLDRSLTSAHTCTKILDISSEFGPDALDGTEESFIENLKSDIRMMGFNRL